MKKNNNKLILDKFKVARIGKLKANIFGGTDQGDGDTDQTDTLQYVTIVACDDTNL